VRQDKLPKPCEKQPFTQTVDNQTITNGIVGSGHMQDTKEECSEFCSTPRVCTLKDGSQTNCGAAVYNNADGNCTCYI
jgi:hypothetical protein